VLGPEPQDFIGDRRYRNGEREPDQHVEDRTLARDEREEDDGQERDEEQEGGAAAWVRGRVRGDALGHERISVLEGVDGHVLRSVIREDAANVRHERDRDEIADQQREANEPFSDVQQQRARCHATGEARGRVRHADEKEECGREGDTEHKGVPARAQRLLASALHVRRPHEHAHSVVDRLPEHHDAADERQAGDA